LPFGPADRLEWVAAIKDLPRRLLCQSDCDRPRFPHPVSDRVLDLHDGPFLELGLKGIVGQVIQLPRRNEDHPDRDRLALRFEEFKKSA
jgi:hypothetical protein